jgi:hypothetical protein
MGQEIDKPITVWDDMFLPSEIGMRINDFRYTGADGRERPLVSAVEIVNSSVKRPAVLDVPRLQWPRQLLFSTCISAFLIFLYFIQKRNKSKLSSSSRHEYYRIFMGLVQSALGLFFGIAGSMLFFLSFFTNHDYTYRNVNILFVNPLFLAAIPLGIIFAFSKNQKKRFLALRLSRVFWIYVLLGALLSMAVKLFPAFFQQNQVTQALVLPIALGMVFIFTRLRSELVS